jgi:LAO/AO transport system kinase
MPSDLTKQILKGNMRALARLMTLIENNDSTAKAVLKALYPHTGKAHVVGVTGAMGTGKSSLIDRITAEYRRRKKSVGILAVDPSSPFSSGACWATGFGCMHTSPTPESLSGASPLAEPGAACVRHYAMPSICWMPQERM